MRCHNFLSNKRQVLILTLKVVQLYPYLHTRSYYTNPNLNKVTGFLQMHIFKFSLKLCKKQHFLVFWSQPFTCKIKLVKFKLMVASPHPTWPNKTKSKFWNNINQLAVAIISMLTYWGYFLCHMLICRCSVPNVSEFWTENAKVARNTYLKISENVPSLFIRHHSNFKMG